MSCLSTQQCYMQTSAELAILVNRLESCEGISGNLLSLLKQAQALVPRPPVEQTEAKWDGLLKLKEDYPPEVAFRIWMAAQQGREREARMKEMRAQGGRGRNVHVQH